MESLVVCWIDHKVHLLEVRSSDEVAGERTSCQLNQTGTNGAGADTRPADFVQLVRSILCD